MHVARRLHLRVLARVVRDQRRAGIVELVARRARAAVRQQPVRRRAAAQARHDDAVRLTGNDRHESCWIVGRGDGGRRVHEDAVAVRAPVTRRVAVVDAVLILVLVADDDVAAAVEEILTGREPEAAVVAVAVAGRAVVALELEAREVLVEHDVDDARDGVGAVRRRSTARHRLHAVDDHRRNEVQIDAAALVRRYVTHRIDERQRARAEVRVQAAQVRHRGADEERAAAGRGRLKSRDVGGVLNQRFADADKPEIAQIFAVDRRRRRRRGVVAAADATAGDRQLFDGFLLRERGRRRRQARPQSTETRVSNGQWPFREASEIPLKLCEDNRQGGWLAHPLRRRTAENVMGQNYTPDIVVLSIGNSS